MARNEEKSHGMMNKWTAMRAGTIGGKSGTQAQHRQRQLSRLRPNECNDLSEAELARKVLMREITAKVEEIQNAGLGEHVIKELNDEINDKLRRKRTWEKRIIELNGPNYMRLAPKVFDADGRELPGTGGYKYFGAARSLPIVQRLFQKKKKGEARRSRNQILNGLRANYFLSDSGGGGSNNGAILRAESSAEASLRARYEAERSTAGEGGEGGEGGDSMETSGRDAFDVVARAVRESVNVTLADICREEVETVTGGGEVDGAGGDDMEAMRRQLLARLG